MLGTLGQRHAQPRRPTPPGPQADRGSAAAHGAAPLSSEYVNEIYCRLNHLSRASSP